jgi:outer membrane protein OmpA-like peptidoglycan-associated protein
MPSLPLARARITGCAVLLLLVFGCLATQSARAGVFPITESFRNSTAGPDWKSGGSAALTAGTDGEGAGWLRLTGAVNNQFGVMVDDAAFPSTNGILAEFEYATWGGTGADGLVFFLYDGATPFTSFATGPTGGSIGYTSCPQNSMPGLTNAYIGVAFDEWGNFSNSTFCNQNGGFTNGLAAGRVAVRAGATSDYQYLTSSAVSQGLSATRTQARKIKVAITPDMKLSVYITYPDGTIQTVADHYALPANAPSTLKMGFVAATGGSNNNHEIRSTQVVLPSDLHTTVTDGVTGSTRGSHTWTSVVTNDGPNPVTGATVKATSGQAGLSNVTWTCTAAGGAACATASGTGLPDTAADLPVGASTTYVITGDLAATSDYATLTVDAEHAAGGETGESDPTNNRAADATDLTPVNDVAPTATLAANGTATLGAVGTWRGADLVYTRNWQRCDGDGTNCADISGATSTTYSTQAADAAKTLRLRVHATNDAGSADAYSAVFTLPDTTIVAGPNANTTSTSAVFAFSTTGAAGTTYQCSLDGAPFATCTGTPTFTGLSEGDHTLATRARYGGLVDSTPATRTWTVDHSTVVTLSSPTAGIIATRRPTATGTAEPGATLTITVDGVTVATGVANTDGTYSIPVPVDLPDGGHTIAVTGTDALGNTATASTAVTVDATAPDVPTVTAGPSSTTNTRDATFTVAAQEHSTLRCRLDGGEWKQCVMPYTVTGLPDGPHTLSVIAIDEAGNESPRVDRTWTVDTTPPAAPPVMSGPATTTTGNTARFAFSLEPGSTLECALDGGAFAPCSSDVELTGLSDGHHVLVVRQVDAAGNPGAPARYEWTITPAAGPAAKTPSPRPATRLSARVAEHVTASDNRRVSVGCVVNQANLTSCRVRVYATTPSGRRVLIGTGSRTLSNTGHRSAVVSITLNATGRRMLGRAIGGMNVRLAATGNGRGSKTLTTATHTVLYPQHLTVLPTINPFVFDSTKMINRVAYRALKRIAADIRHARTVTCVGHTDSDGSNAYNQALGLRRARTVCDALMHLGVHAHRRAFSDGETQPRANNATQAGRLVNRRVELRIGY